MLVERDSFNGGPPGHLRRPTIAVPKKGRTMKGKCSNASLVVPSWIRRLFFSWVSPVVKLCTQRQISPDDLPPLSKSDHVGRQSAAIKFAISAEEEAILTTGRKPSVLRAILRVFWVPILISFLWSAIKETLVFSNAFLLKKILQQGCEWETGIAVARREAGAHKYHLLLLPEPGYSKCYIFPP